MKPSVVIVHSSESPLFPNPDTAYSFEAFERVALLASQTPEESRTEVTLVFNEGSELACTLYLNYRESVCVQDYLGDLQVHLAKEEFNDADKNNVLLEFLSAIEWTKH